MATKKSSSARAWDSDKAWRFSGPLALPALSRDEFQHALYGTVLRFGWDLDQLARGELEDRPHHSPPAFRLAPADYARLRDHFGTMMAEITRARVEPNVAFAARQDLAVQTLLARAEKKASTRRVRK